MVETTKETNSLFVIDNMQRLGSLKVEGTNPIRHSFLEGDRKVLHDGASSKSLLAYADESIVREVCRQMVEAKPEQNPEQMVKQLLDELKQIRRLRYACSDGEVTPNLSALSCPVFDYGGLACAAMTVTGPTYRFSMEKKKQLLSHLQKAASNCSRALGYDGQDVYQLDQDSL